MDVDYRKLEDEKYRKETIYKLVELVNALEQQNRDHDRKLEDHEKRLDDGGL